MVFDFMIPIATFDFLPTDDFYPLIFDTLPERDSFSEEFDRLEYGSYYILMNLGTMLIIFFVTVAFYVVYPAINLLTNLNNCTRWLQKKL